MAFDFPASPTVGQEYNNYVWNGYGWGVKGGSEAPSDGKVYGRKNGAWAEVLPPDVAKSYVDAQDALKVAKAGDTMSGLLTLSADPTALLHAATKQYVDNKVVNVSGNYVLKTGDTMSGALTVNSNINLAGGITANGFNSSIELGLPGTSNTPFIDFHSGPTANDYDVRLIAIGGVAAGGHGQLQVAADQTLFTGTIDSSSPTSGTVRVDGGLGVVQNIYTSGAVVVKGTRLQNAQLILDKTTGGASYIRADTNGSPRCTLLLTDWSGEIQKEATPEPRANDGSNFAIYNYDNAGNYLRTAFAIIRSSGQVQVPTNIPSSLWNNGALVVSGGVGIAGNTFLHDDMNTGALCWNLGHKIGRNASTGSLFIGGGQYRVEINAANPLTVNNTTASTNASTGAITVGGGAGIQGSLNVAGEIIGRTPNSFCSRVGKFGMIQHNDTADRYYFIPTAAWAIEGGLGGLRPLIINMATGGVDLGYTVTVGANLFVYGGYAYLGTSGVNYACTDNTNYIIRTNGRFYVQNSSGINRMFCETNGWLYVTGNVVSGPCANINSIGSDAYFSNPNTGGWVQHRNDGWFICTTGAAKPGGGLWTDSSDARLKTVLGDYRNGLAEVLKLAPKRYLFKGNDTYGELTKDNLDSPVESPHKKAAADGVAFVGLVAQDVEDIMPEMVLKTSGRIDGEKVDDIRMLDTTPLMFALVNSIKELAATVQQLTERVAQLETRAI